jgi:hypothetical protein
MAMRGLRDGSIQRDALMLTSPLRDALDETLRPYLEVLKVPAHTIDLLLDGAAARLSGFHGVALSSAPDHRLREALDALERDREDSLDSGWTQVPKGTMNMVIDLIEGVLSEAALSSPPDPEEPRG